VLDLFCGCLRVNGGHILVSSDVSGDQSGPRLYPEMGK